jgi:hypothetical protein
MMFIRRRQNQRGQPIDALLLQSLRYALPIKPRTGID